LSVHECHVISGLSTQRPPQCAPLASKRGTNLYGARPRVRQTRSTARGDASDLVLVPWRAGYVL